MSKMNINLIEQARHCIASGDIQLAFSLINPSLSGHRERNDFLLLENQFNNWSQNQAKGLAPSNFASRGLPSSTPSPLANN
jgi:hypothetical protein